MTLGTDTRIDSAPDRSAGGDALGPRSLTDRGVSAWGWLGTAGIVRFLAFTTDASHSCSSGGSTFSRSRPLSSSSRSWTAGGSAPGARVPAAAGDRDGLVRPVPVALPDLLSRSLATCPTLPDTGARLLLGWGLTGAATAFLWYLVERQALALKRRRRTQQQDARRRARRGTLDS